jgi:hypothetical protein
MQGRDDVAGFIAGFAGDDRYVVYYLVEEMVKGQSDRVRAFLQQTSILNRMSGPLCDAVTGQGGGGAMLEVLDRANLQAHRLVEVHRCLVGREAQVGRTHLDQLASRPQAGQWEGRIGAAGDHQMHLRRQMFEQERRPVLHITGVDDVVVVEHQHQVARDAEVVEQRGQHPLDRRRLGLLQERQRALADPGGPVRSAAIT